MPSTTYTTQDLQVLDLVLDPFTCREALLESIHHGGLDVDEAAHLATALCQAVDQLDAIGDFHGALALTGLYNQLTKL